jgi:MoxR-like ATPase
MALIRGRDYCVPDDVKQLADPVLSHRLIYQRYSGANSNHAIQEILKKITVPV